MEVEIELKSAALSGDIYELKKYLEENIEGLRLEIKTQPAPEGQMIIEAIGIGILHGVLELTSKQATKIIADQGKRIIHLIKEWNRKNISHPVEKNSVQALGPGVSLIDEDKRFYITEDQKGDTQVFDNFNFAIDAKHTYALLIGVSEFDSDFPPIPPIRNNLVDFYNLLVDRRHVGLPRENVQVIFNKTDHEIEETMLGISRIPGMETLIIYYSGHGHKSDVKSLTLTARNTKKIGGVILGGIDLSFVTDKVLRPSTASQKILILDACHSGIAAQGDDEIVKLIDVKGTYTLTSSGDEASYFDKGAQNTFFTGALLELLRNGINDVTKEMLSLEDMYQLSSERLAAEKFPRPNSKNELNIPAADFFLAHNPSFSAEKLKSRAAMLMKQGKLQEANHEYILLSKRYPDDTELKKQADECRDRLAFIQLVDEGDQFYFNSDYKRAAERYKRALEIKDDITVAGRLSKCEGHIKAAAGQTARYSQEQSVPAFKERIEKRKDENPLKEHEENPKHNLPPPPPKKREEPLPFVQTFPATRSLPSDEKNKLWIALAAVWLILSIVILWTTSTSGSDTSDESFFQRILNKACLPFLIVAGLLIGIRNNKITNTELLIYITGALPASFILTIKLTNRDPDFTTASILLIIQGIFYFIYLRKFVQRFSITDFVIACIPVLYFSLFIFIMLSLGILGNNATGGYTGLVFGGITTILAIILFNRIRKRRLH